MLAGAGLMMRSLWALQRIDLGFNPDRVLTMRLALPASQYDTAEKVVGFYRDLVTRVRALPGVEQAGPGSIASARHRDRRLGPDGRGLHAAAGRRHAGRLAGRDRTADPKRSASASFAAAG